jgi:hypothetical protein
LNLNDNNSIMRKLLCFLSLAILCALTIEASFVDKIVNRLHSKSKHGGVILAHHSPNHHSSKSRAKSNVAPKKKEKSILHKIGFFGKHERKTNSLSKMDAEIEKEMKANREMLKKKKEAQKNRKKEKRRKLLLEKKKKKLMKRELKERKLKRVRQRLLRRFDHLDTPMQVNKLKKIYQNYGINFKKLNNSDLKFLVENSKKLLQTYYNPQAMQGELIRSGRESQNA